MAVFGAAVCGWFTWNAWLTDRASVAFMQSAVPPDTLRGVEEPRFFTSPDSYAWLSHVRQLMMGGGWRVRHTQMDNAPGGRAMHWSHLPIWEMAGLAHLAGKLDPEMPVARRVELAGRCAMPVFFLTLVPPLFWAYWRKLGFAAAAAFLGMMAVHPLCAPAFGPMAPDHHALQFLLALGAVTGLTFGGWGRVAATAGTEGGVGEGFWARRPSAPGYEEAQGWFWLAGASDAGLLWVGASVWMVVHGALCAAAVAGMGKGDGSTRAVPRLWGHFFGVALALSAVFYLLEYAPQFPGMRLEVNHPLHWLFLGGTTMALLGISAWSTAETRKERRRAALSIATGALAALALPAALVFGPAGWHALHDPFLKRLHARCIVEFHPYLPVILKNPKGAVQDFRFLLPALAVAPVLGFWPGGGTGGRERRRSWGPHGVLAVAFAALTLAQLRWSALLSAALVFPLMSGTNGLLRERRWLGWALWGAFMADVLWLGWCETSGRWKALRDKAPMENWEECDMAKRAALRLAALSRGREWALAGDATDATVFHWFGGIPSLASYYWENAEGWRIEAALMAAPENAVPEAVLEEVRRRGVTHVLAAQGEQSPELYLYVATGVADPERAHRRTVHGILYHHGDKGGGGAIPGPFDFDKALSAALSQTNYYHVSGMASNVVRARNLKWEVFRVSGGRNAPNASPCQAGDAGPREGVGAE